MRAQYTYDFTGRRITKLVDYKPSADTNLTHHESRITTTYVDEHFEVREHDQPTKYVFNGSTRVARVIGSLSTSSRIQRFRVRPGWNLLSAAVSAADLSGQLRQAAPGQPSAITSIYYWNPH